MGSKKTVTLSREDLYHMVWDTPMLTLAKAYEVSDTGLAQICKAHKIPRPPAGYWQKKAVGKQPPTPPLPTCNEEKLQTISLVWIPEEERNRVSPKAVPVVYDDDIAALLARAASMPHTKVSTVLRGLHRTILATKRGLDGKKADRYGLVSASWSEEPTALDLAVAPKSVRRALCLLNALVRGVEALDGSVSNVQNKGQTFTAVKVAGEQVASLRLRERVNRKPTPADSKRTQIDHKYDWLPNGLFDLEFGVSSCHDTEKHKIEDSLDHLLINLIKSAGDLRIQRRQKETIERRQAEERRIKWEQEQGLRKQRDELAAKQKTEKARVDSLLSDAHDWHESQILRTYIKAVEDVIRKQGDIEYESQADQWIKWAQMQADRLDPLVESPYSILDEEV